MTQTFQDLSNQQFADLSVSPGTSWVILAEPVPLLKSSQFGWERWGNLRAFRLWRQVADGS
jgi:hypothetical protein